MCNNYLITGATSPLAKAFINTLKNRKDVKIFLTSRKRLEVKDDFDNIAILDGIDLLCNNDLQILSQEVDKFFDSKFNIVNSVGRYYKMGHQVFCDISIDEAQDIMMSNYMTVYNVAKNILPIQIQKGGGHFVGFSCTSVNYMYPTMAAFASAKSALETLIGSIANEYYKDGIIANTFRLSTLNTDEEKKLKPNGDFNNWLAVDQVADFVCNFIEMPNNLISGNNMHIYKHSETFFGSSFYDRIDLKNE